MMTEPGTQVSSTPPASFKTRRGGNLSGNRVVVPQPAEILRQRRVQARNASFTCYALPTLTEEAAVAVKQVRVSDLSGRQADEDQFAKLIVHEHPQYQGPITLDVLPEELGELPESDQYVSIEVMGPGERSGQRALLSVERV
jgi:hypothetical protein